MAKPTWTHRPEGSNWGDYGADDRLGRLHNLTPQAIVAAAREVQKGLRFCLGLPLDYPGGSVIHKNRKPPIRDWVDRGDGTIFREFLGQTIVPSATDVINDDFATIWLQYSSQWDSFAHIGSLFDANGDGEREVVYYNGLKDHDLTDAAVAGLQGRGVLFDLRRHFGEERRAVNLEMLEGVMRSDGIDVRSGDFLCFHTGYGARLLEMKGNPDPAFVHSSCTVLDANDPRLLRWVDESGIVAMISDNVAIEASLIGRPREKYPSEGPFLPLHELCLVKIGVLIGELWYLTELAEWLCANKRSSFLLTAQPLRLPGAVGSPVTPIATV